jgi:surface carbohydrate biosynthesis protein (TIGR04326 family)
MLLWNATAGSLPDHGNVLLWQGAAREPGVRSLTEYIEINAEEIRRRYLAWSHDLGETSVLGRRLRERFKLADGTSFWWLSTFVEQSTWKQHSLETLLKLFALDLLLDQESPTELSFQGSDRAVHLVLRAICRRRDIRYRWLRTPRKSGFAWRRVVNGVPRFFQGLLAFAYFTWMRLALQRPPAAVAADSKARIVICGPFANHNATAYRGPEFASRYWGTLPQALAQDGFEVDWLHYFYAHDRVPTPWEARRILRRIHEESSRVAGHAFVESYLPVPCLATIFGRWLAIAAESFLVGLSLRARFAKDPGESYWPVIRDDWARSFRGFGSVQNLFYDRCFDHAWRMTGRYDECIYLMENQSWERALARAWRKHQRGRLTGVAHSTVRFWDLRYHCDPRRYESEYRSRLPAPDCVALNGRMAREEYLKTCSEREPVADCEALRYLHLAPANARDLSEVAQGGALRILVLGDYTQDRTDALVQVAEGARNQTSVPVELRVKPHPGCPVDPLRYPQSALRIVNDAVAGLVSSAHLVLASNTTSAALEAYLCGGRVLVLDDRRGVNYSPLRRIQGVSFIADADDLRREIESLQPGAGADRRQTDGFFNIDPALPNWRRYFGSGRARTV